MGTVELTGVGIRYGRRAPWVLQGVTLRLPAGVLVEVTGRNGSGKSSLLRVLAGVLAPAAGRVEGLPVVVGYVPERFPVEQSFTARSYLLAQARMRGMPEVDAGRAVLREAARLHLDAFLDTPLSALSKGSAQKVGLAQALLAPPGMLVLDEPWSGLDAETRAAFPDLVGEVLGAGGRVVVSDHQQQAARLTGSRRWHVEDGRVEPVERVEPVLAPTMVPPADTTAVAGVGRRALALTGFALSGAVRTKTLLAPVVALAAVELVGFAGAGAPAAVALVTAVSFAFPFLSWAARQVLDAQPDEQAGLSALAVGGRGRADLAVVLAAYAVAAVLCVAAVGWGALNVDGNGLPVSTALAGLALALCTAGAAVAVGSLAARRSVGDVGGAVVVLVGATVLVAVLGLSHTPAVSLTVPRLGPALRAAYDGRFPAALPGLALQILLWAVVVVGTQLGIRHRRSLWGGR